MGKKFKKVISLLLILLTVVSTLFTGQNYLAEADDSVDDGALPFRELTGEEITEEMGAGWNLGNTFDGHTGFTPNETVWQNVKTTKALITSVHDMGFNTIRIPVTWGTMIDDENNYEIDEAWISRVEDVVDYAIEQDMYVIINIHHDGAEQMGWLRIATDDKEALYEKFGGVWKNIAERFKNYDEHLIFEAMNEVKGENMTLAEENAVIMDLNQIFVDTVRATGANNAKRWLVVCGKYNVYDSLVNPNGHFELPVDSVENRIMLSVHNYTTWNFCGMENTSVTSYSLTELQNYNEKELKTLEQFTSQGIPVIVGEYGCINKDNPEERAFFLEGMNKIFKKYKLIGIYWDQGWYDRSQKPDYSFTIIDRETGESVDKSVTDALLRGFFTRDGSELKDLEKNTTVNAITEVNVEESIELTIGDTCHMNVTVTPADTNDVLLYKTNNPAVATVYNGMIRAKGIGEAEITVFSQSGSVEKTVKVSVKAESLPVSCDNIYVSEETLSLSVGDYFFLNASVETPDCQAYLRYRSSDDEVATVSSVGKIVAVGEGEAVITVTSSDGFTREVKVTVGEEELITEIILALNVYYNDSAKNYFSNEVSTRTVTVKGDGQYTLSFDCATDLSEAAIAAGVDSLNNLTAIYIKDYSVTEGKAGVSPLDSCDIMYDEIKVNGTPMTITQTQPKSALKDSGIFDTNDPVNAWDGSSIKEVSVNNHVANITGIKATSIEVTFTLSNVKFTGVEEEQNPVQEEEPDVVQPENSSETENQVTPEVTQAEEDTTAGVTPADENQDGFPVVWIMVVAAMVIIVAAAVVVQKKKGKRN
ncbi:MAG: cellulase family glycosylhydrolase [Lachnospiraceae bacterium]